MWVGLRHVRHFSQAGPYQKTVQNFNQVATGRIEC
jgi:hypothetical protein